MINVVDFANAVWYAGSQEYQNRIPEATRENILEVGECQSLNMNQQETNLFQP